MPVEQIADAIYRLEVETPQASTAFVVYFLRDEPGILIEPGPAVTVSHILEAMKQLGMTDLAYIIPSHIHMDHAGALGSLAQLFPRATVLIHPVGLKHVVNPTRLIEGTRAAFGEGFEAIYGPILPVDESQARAVADMEVVSTASRQLQIVHTPGHAPHHIAILDMGGGGLFCGEALGMLLPGTELPVPIAAPPSFDMELYLQSMGKLRQLQPRTLFYSHNGTGRDPDMLITQVGAHTKVMGNLILEALRRGEGTEAIRFLVSDYFLNHMAAGVSGWDMSMTVDGFILYFKKKGLA